MVVHGFVYGRESYFASLFWGDVRRDSRGIYQLNRSMSVIKVTT